jgi:hypothetical protein
VLFIATSEADFRPVEAGVNGHWSRIGPQSGAFPAAVASGQRVDRSLSGHSIVLRADEGFMKPRVSEIVSARNTDAIGSLTRRQIRVVAFDPPTLSMLAGRCDEFTADARRGQRDDAGHARRGHPKDYEDQRRRQGISKRKSAGLYRGPPEDVARNSGIAAMLPRGRVVVGDPASFQRSLRWRSALRPQACGGRAY